MSKALSGVRVIDMTHNQAGPACTQMLAWLGAEVIKLESPNGGDVARQIMRDKDGDGLFFLVLNANKQSLTLNLKTDEGKALFKKLMAESDVLVENFSPGALDRLGLGYDVIKAINPGIIYTQIKGFAVGSPYEKFLSFDMIGQATGGTMSITGEAPGREPVKVGAPVTDITAGILGALGVAAAYAHKLKTGEGQMVDTSLFEAGITHTYWQSAIALATGEAPGPMGSRHPLNAPYQAFRTKDGWINIGASNTRNWQRLVDLLGRPELADDPRFEDGAARMANIDAMVDILNTTFETRPQAEWLSALEAVGIPAGPVLDINEMNADPHTLARDMVVEVDHPTAGPVKTIGCPVKFSKTPGGVESAAPLFGQHTREVLIEHGYEVTQIDTLITGGAVMAGPAD